ncbi:transposase [Streptomyces mobaraensis]|uniref:transposase n=1 Tax=Streptomyces mobaraensis TaxID=35621 RepID=UPI001F3A6A01|nr:transposase [Streptomyces mobaraensis]
MAQLLRLRAAGELRTAHVRLVADAVGVHIRTVWTWLAQAEGTGSPEKPERRRFRVTEEVIEVLADYQGNVKRAHERLVEMAVAAGERPPGLTTLHDAIARDLDPGFMAGLREGIPAARGFDPAFQRPAVARNQVWEGDHKQAETVVMMPDGKPAKVWVTWFEDRGTGYVMGWAVTAGSAHRGSVLAAVRASVLREAPYGPPGGLPHLVRVDGGADFLSKTVRRAFGLLGVPVHQVRSARHKGGVERLNRTSMTRFFADLPRYTKAPRLDHRRRLGDTDPPLMFEEFVRLLGEWVHQHNTEHVIERTGMTPLEAWQADPTEIRPEPSASELRAFMLESDHRPRKITSHGWSSTAAPICPRTGWAGSGSRSVCAGCRTTPTRSTSTPSAATATWPGLPQQRGQRGTAGQGAPRTRRAQPGPATRPETLRRAPTGTPPAVHPARGARARCAYDRAGGPRRT